MRKVIPALSFRNLLWLVSLTITSCSSQQRYYDRDKKREAYAKGEVGPLVQPTPYNLQTRPGNDSVQAQRRSEFGNDPGSALVYGTVGAIALATNPSYYKKSSISGRCVFDAPRASNMKTPCINVTIILTNSKGKELARTTVEQGGFAFSVKRGERYGLKLGSTSLEIHPEDRKKLQMGDDILVRVRKIDP